MHQQLIPERDTGPFPKPKPRSRTSTTGPGTMSKVTESTKVSSVKYPQENDIDDVISLSSISSASIKSNGVDNLAFKDDEGKESRLPLPGIHPRPQQQPTQLKQMTTIERKYFSSDSENDNQGIVQRQILAADIHTHNFSVEATSPKDVHPTQNVFELQERSTWGSKKLDQPKRSPSPSKSRHAEVSFSSSPKPKPKPRSKTNVQVLSESEESSDTKKSIGVSSLLQAKSQVPTKEDYLIVTMPQEPNSNSNNGPKDRENPTSKLTRTKHFDSDDDSGSDTTHSNSGSTSGSESNSNEESTAKKSQPTGTKNKNNSGNLVSKWKKAAQALVSTAPLHQKSKKSDKNNANPKDRPRSGQTTKRATKTTLEKPDTRIDIEVLESSRENIQQPSSPVTKTKTKGVTKLTTKFGDKYNKLAETSSSKPDTKTRALLKRDEESEIERLKAFVSPTAKRKNNKQKNSSGGKENQEEDGQGQSQGQSEAVTSGSPTVNSPSKRQRRRVEKLEGGDKYFGVIVHSCDLLPMDPNIVHPVVKVTILNEDGSCVIKNSVSSSNGRGSSPGTALHLSSPPRSKAKKKADDKSLSKKEREELLEATRKSRSKSRNLNLTSSSYKSMMMGSLTPKITAESVLPIMTQPCKLSYSLPTFAPHWNELLLFEEPFASIVHPDSTAILFFEIMDFLPVQGSRKTSRLFSDYHGSEEGWYKVAWGFLKLIGANRVRNVNRKVRLQLYKPEQLPSKYNKGGIEVFQWWKLNRRRKLNATLYVTAKGIIPPAKTSSSLQTLLTMRKDHLAQAILESQLKSPKADKTRDSSEELKRKFGKTDIKMPQWNRLDGQSCKVPNKIFKTLPVSQIESLNLTISGNVQCVTFSPCGMKLAAGLDTDELHTILVFEIPSGKLQCNIRCHHGLIYDLDWKIVEMRNISIPKSYYLASASADTTCTVWEIHGSGEGPKLIKKLLHPSFVYCVKIHPTKSNLIFTGCFDYVIRIWDIQKGSPSRPNVYNIETESVPIGLLDKHDNFVNCIIFDGIGNHIYSGDGGGTVFEWTTRSPGKKKSWKVDREIQFRESGKCPVNSLAMHPSGNRLLVHVRNSSIKIVDLPTFLVLHTFNGLVNDKLQVQSCFSPCGNIVLSGSEDATLCIWDADTGSILQLLTPENHRNCTVTSVDYHPHDHYVAIGLASTISEPCPIILYTYVPPKPARKLRLQTLSKFTILSNKSSSNFDSQDLQSNDPHNPDQPDISGDLDGNLSKASGSGFGNFGRGDSTEKFMMIVKKLDSALKATRRSQHAPNLNSDQQLQPPIPKAVKASKEKEIIDDIFSGKTIASDPSKSKLKTKWVKDGENQNQNEGLSSPNKIAQNQKQSTTPKRFSKSISRSETPADDGRDAGSMDVINEKVNSRKSALASNGGDTVWSGSAKRGTRSSSDHLGDNPQEGDPNANVNVRVNSNDNKSSKEVEDSDPFSYRSSPIQEEPEKDNYYGTSDASGQGQVSRVRQKRREKNRLLYESSDY